MVRQLLDDLAQRKGPGGRSSECQPPSSEMSHNGTVTYSDDFREQCFLLQLLKIKFIVRQDLERSISKIKSFFSSSSYLKKKGKWLVGEPGMNT